MEQNVVEEAVKKYCKSVSRAAFAYTKNISDAEDITQDVFVALLEHETAFMSEDHLKAWLIRTAINKAKNYQKSHWLSRRISLSHEWIAEQPCHDNSLLDAVMELKPAYRIVIHLYYYEGYSIREISEILKINPSTIGSRLKRGRDQLQTILGEGR